MQEDSYHVYIGDRIYPDDKAGLGNLANYIIRACFSQERMIYIPAEESTDGIAKVVYISELIYDESAKASLRARLPGSSL